MKLWLGLTNLLWLFGMPLIALGMLLVDPGTWIDFLRRSYWVDTWRGIFK